MMAKRRDYRQEYARRKASGERRGFSLSRTRGHARYGEQPARPRPNQAHDDQLEAALKLFRTMGNQSAAAKAVGISPERFRRFLRENVEVSGRGRTLRINDDRLRDVPIYSAGKQLTLRVRGHEPASLAGKHHAAAGKFLRTQNRDLLSDFEGVSVTDAKGKSHLLETDPNALYRIDAAGEPAFHEIYRIIAPEN